MKTKYNPLYSAITGALAVALVGGAASTTAVAQTDDESAAELDTFEVTGTRIRRAQIEGAQPVTVLEREDLLRTQATTVGEFIRRLPSSSGSPITTVTNNGGTGSEALNLRGLGAARTLVLVDGRRVVLQDIQTIPLAFIERVEVLKDGASAIYGADAVAGVVNFILRTGIEGGEFQIDYSDWQDVDGDSDQGRVSVLFGARGDKGGFNIGTEYRRQEQIFQGAVDIEYFQNPFNVLDPDGFRENRDVSLDNPSVVFLGSSRTPQGVFDLRSGGDAVTLIDGRPGTSPDDFRTFIGGLGANNDTYNFQPSNLIQTPFEIRSAYVSGDYEVADGHRVYGNIRYTHRESNQQLAPLPFDNGVGDPGADLGSGRTGISADNFYNPFGEDVTRFRRRMVETGGRVFTQDVSTAQMVIGVEGDLFNSGWRYDTSINYGKREFIQEDEGQFVGSRIQNALGPSFFDSATGEVVCGTPDSPIPDCVSLNLLGGAGSITQEMLDYVSATLVSRTETEQEIYNLNLVNDALFDLPAGPLGFAVGYENRREYLADTPDSGEQTAAVTGNTGDVTEGAINVDSLYVETIIPLLSGVTGVDSLELNLGARYDDFRGFDDTTFQGGLRWQVTPELLIRGTYSEVFRAPTITNLFQGGFRFAPSVSDPCNNITFDDLSADEQARCIAQGVPQGGYQQDDTQVSGFGGGNPNLGPETGDTFTVGLAWSPSGVLDGLSVTLDYFEIELDNAINSFEGDEIVDQCIAFGQPEFCNRITRDLTGETLGVVGAITGVTTTPLNIAVETARGVDLGLAYNRATDYGNWDFSLNYSRFLEREFDAFGDGNVDEFEGTFSTALDESYHEHRALGGITWSLGSFSVDYSLEYKSEIEAAFNFFEDDGTYTVDDILYHDLGFRYSTPFNSQIQFGVTNITDEDPPFIDAAFSSSVDEANYRLFGRGYFVRYTQDF